jgi:hypothetical protein
VHGRVSDLVDDFLPGSFPYPAEVLGQLGLPIDRDAAPYEVHEVQVMPVAGPVQVDAAVDVALPVQSLAHPDLAQEVHCGLFQDSGPDTRLDVPTRAGLHDDGLDTRAVKQMRQQQSCRAGADDGDLGAHATSLAAAARWHPA